jgi:hypothetical protein
MDVASAAVSLDWKIGLFTTPGALSLTSFHPRKMPWEVNSGGAFYTGATFGSHDICDAIKRFVPGDFFDVERQTPPPIRVLGRRAGNVRLIGQCQYVLDGDCE